MSTQKHFFADFDAQALTPIARTTDPITSHVAASEIDLGECRSTALAAAKQLGEGTAREIGELAATMGPKECESYRKRVGELERKGLLQEAGERKCRFTNKLATVYQVKQ
jgi:hypothetical protein